MDSGKNCEQRRAATREAAQIIILADCQGKSLLEHWRLAAIVDERDIT